MNRINDAVAEFKKGFSCAQAIFSVYSEDQLIDREISLKIATGFGGGMGRLGNVCGAVTGALMALGLKFGQSKIEEADAKDTTYQLVNKFITKFITRNNSIVCKELLGYSLNIPEEMQIIREQNLIATRCVKFVQDAAEILEELM